MRLLVNDNELRSAAEVRRSEAARPLYWNSVTALLREDGGSGICELSGCRATHAYVISPSACERLVHVAESLPNLAAHGGTHARSQS